MNPIPSPVTGGGTSHSTYLDSEIIVERYATAGVDVARYFEGLPKVEVRKCDDTGYRFYFPPTLAGEADFYSELPVPEYREWNEEFQFAFDRLVPGERVFDIGCGFGSFLARAAEKAEVIGLDGNIRSKSRCAEIGLNVLCGSIEEVAEEFAECFDTITAFQVLEHIYDVRSFLTAAIGTLRSGGRFILAVPNNDPYRRRWDAYNTWNLPPHHIGLWNRHSIEAMAPRFGLTVEEIAFHEVSARWVVDAYLHARHLMNVTSEIHHHSFGETLRILLAAPITLPLSLAARLRKGQQLTENVITAVLRKT